jgi:CBS domain-containing protein
MKGETVMRRVNEVMTGPIVRVGSETRAREAERAAHAGGARHVLVFDSDLLAGTACICALRDAPEATLVAERMKSLVFVVAAKTPVFDAAEVMRDRSLSCLPVVEAGVFVGVLTRDDLRRAGVPDHVHSRRRCASCGTTEHVRSDPRSDATRFCVDCLDQSHAPEGHEDLGGGG